MQRKAGRSITQLESTNIGFPRMPALIRYLDPHAETWKTIKSPSTNLAWALEVNGDVKLLEFERVPEQLRPIMRNVMHHALLKYAPSTTALMFEDFVWLINVLGPEVISAPLSLDPLELRQFWITDLLPELIDGHRNAQAPKFYLKFLCKNSLGRLQPGHEKFVSRLPGPKADLYASVRSSNVFLSDVEQLTIVNYLDDLSEAAGNAAIDKGRLRDACLLIAAFQYAMRPIQIARVKRYDVRVRNSVAIDGTIVHVRFPRVKQLDSKKRTPLLRKIKREWAVLYAHYYSVASVALSKKWANGGRHFFELSPSEVHTSIKRILLNLLGRSRSATDLRHTAAQRLVDRGASHEELAEFLGHTSLRTGLIYFRESATQADRLNKALSSSKIYSEISLINRHKMVNASRLRTMSADHQVGGVPHGVPIAGIGACEVGQSICTKSPVLSCYGCRKFMPVRSMKVHKEVIGVLRAVAKQFFDVSPSSPAYAQLTFTIAAVEKLIGDEQSQ